MTFLATKRLIGSLALCLVFLLGSLLGHTGPPVALVAPKASLLDRQVPMIATVAGVALGRESSRIYQDRTEAATLPGGCYANHGTRPCD